MWCQCLKLAFSLESIHIRYILYICSVLNYKLCLFLFLCYVWRMWIWNISNISDMIMVYGGFISDWMLYCRKFYERIILCNSLVWTCSLTGRPNLTFQEALHSEKRSREQLNSIPESQRILLLYLAHLTHRSQFKDLVDDVYLFSKDRYFIGEYVTVESSDGRLSDFCQNSWFEAKFWCIT